MDRNNLLYRLHRQKYLSDLYRQQRIITICDVDRVFTFKFNPVDAIKNRIFIELYLALTHTNSIIYIDLYSSRLMSQFC